MSSAVANAKEVRAHQPKVSIIIPAYNAADYIAEAQFRPGCSQ